jgi:hypothetical protein
MDGIRKANWRFWHINISSFIRDKEVVGRTWDNSAVYLKAGLERLKDRLIVQAAVQARKAATPFRGMHLAATTCE